MNEAPVQNKEEVKARDNKFVKALKFIFVKNAALKGAALLLGFLAWLVISIF